MRKNKKLIFELLVILIAALIVFFIFLSAELKNERTVSYSFLSDLKSVSNYKNVIRFAGGDDFSPFAYIDDDGLPCGRDVELAFALGRELGCRVEINLGDWTEMQEGISDGTYDVLMTVDYSEERSKIMGYSNATCLDSYVFFGKDDTIDLSEVSNMQSIKIASLNGGGATDNYIIPMNLQDNTTYYDTQLAAFESVVNGENDVAIAGYIYGLNIIEKNDLGLIQVGNPLYGSAYYFTYNIENSDLGTKLNTALGILESNGEMDRIEDKWTKHYQPNLTLKNYLSQNKETVVIASLVLLVLIFIVSEIVLSSSRKKRKELLEKDYLTGLYNMHSFLERMEKIIEKHDDRHYVLARFDIDNFKSFNNTFGTQFGDELLKNVGSKLINEAKSETVVLMGYFGADHFAVLLNITDHTFDEEYVYECISSIVRDACPGYSLSIRVGFCDIDDSCDDLFRYCDRALLALRSTKNDYYKHWAWYEDNLSGNTEEEKLITDKMFKALQEERFVPYFQPQYDYESGKICGAEALCRWIESDGTVVPPSKFVPVFEKTGFIYEMDKSVWRQSCRIINKWKEMNIMPGHISVNISRADIYHSDLVDTIKIIADEEDVSLDEIYFEITESAYMDNSELLIDTVNRLKEIGAHVEMDDFGSGYSSMSSLKNLAVDTIKLDMSLLENNSLTGKDAALLSAIVHLGHELDLNIIAEGIEQKEQAEYLYNAGCNIMQGYYFSKPVDTDTFEKLILGSASTQHENVRKTLVVV